MHIPDREREAELSACLLLLSMRGLGACARKKTADSFPSLREAGESLLSRARPEDLRLAEQRLQSILACRADILLYRDELYPALLKEIPDAPLLLFYRGDLSLLRNAAVAVVGARHCTQAGIMAAAHIARGLTQAGITVVSGLARGIDRVAHLAGLEGLGKSIAVLGTGIDVSYPGSNLDLYDLMEEKGLLLSEFMPGSAPFAGNFLIRNRIISGLSRGVLVVEAAERSGALNTARHAVEQNREVFAVPGGAIEQSSAGCRELIRRGAGVVFAAEDILRQLAPILAGSFAGEEYNRAEDVEYDTAKPGILPWVNGLAVGQTPAKKALSLPEERREIPLETLGADLPAEEMAVLRLLRQSPNRHINDISQELNLDALCLSGMLTMLEVKGLVRRSPGMLYSLGIV